MTTNHKWIGSDEGMVLKTVTVPKGYSGAVTENGRSIVKAGTLINDATQGYGLLFNDVDVTDEARVASFMIAGFYIDEYLPVSIAESASLISPKLIAVKYDATNVAYGEVIK